MYDILVIGPQGSGKGTQAERLAAKLNIPTVSVGHLFRAEMERGTGLGKEIAEFVERGERAPSEYVDQLIRGRMHEEDCAGGVILDGYPRTMSQNEVLDGLLKEMGRSLTHVLFLNISDEEAVLRLSGRLVCSNLKCEENYHITFNPPQSPDACDKCGSPLMQRDDDKPEAIRRRLELYHADTQPLVAMYRERGILHEIDGTRSIAEVEAAMSAAVGI
jgi:adenylate kinase